MLQLQPARAEPTEADLIRGAANKNEAAIRTLIRQHNRRLFRIARSMLRDDHEAEDVVQESYLRAFLSIAGFRGESSLATWLTRIVINQALQHLRRRNGELPPPGGQTAENVLSFPYPGHASPDPERSLAQRELSRLLERAIDELPAEFRTVLVARVLENMSIEETAELLSLRPETVKTRLYRARRQLKARLAEHLDPVLGDVFPFDGARCERLTDAVMARLHAIWHAGES